MSAEEAATQVAAERFTNEAESGSILSLGLKNLSVLEYNSPEFVKPSKVSTGRKLQKKSSPRLPKLFRTNINPENRVRPRTRGGLNG